MNNREYLRHQEFLEMIVGLVQEDHLNWKGFLAAIEQGEALGPVVNTSLYKQAQENFYKIKQAAEALAPFIRMVEEESHAEVSEKGHRH